VIKGKVIKSIWALGWVVLFGLSALSTNISGQTVYLRNDQPGQTVKVADVTQGATGPATIVTNGPHGLQTGDKVYIARALSPCSAINGTRTVSVLSSTSFTVNDRANTNPVRCELGYKIYLRIEKLNGQAENIYEAYNLNFENPRPSVSTNFYNSLTDGERVVIKMNAPKGCSNWHESASTFVRKESDGRVKIVNSPTGTEWLKCTFGWPYLGDGRDWNTAPTVGKLSPVTLTSTPWGPFDQDLRSRLTGRNGWGVTGNVLKPFVDSFVSQLNSASAGSLEERQLLQTNYKGAGILWGLGTMYAATNGNQYLTSMKRILRNLDNVYPGFGVFEAGRDGGRAIQSRGDWIRFYFFEAAMAYTLIRDELTPTERQEIADRFLNSWDDGCQNNIETMSGNAVLNGRVVIGAGTQFTTEVQRGDVLMIPVNDANQNPPSGSEDAMFDQVFVTQVVSNTVLLVEGTGSQPQSGTLTMGAAAPSGSCTNGSTYLMDVPGAAYKHSFACRSGQWVAGEVSGGRFDPGASFSKASDIRGLTPFYVIKPFRAGQCGYMTTHRYLSNPYLAYDARKYVKETWGDPTHNLAHTSVSTALMIGLALANDDPRAQVLIEEAWAWIHDGSLKWWRDTYSGAPRQYGSGYYVARLEQEPALALLALRNQTAGEINPIGNDAKWVSNSAWSQLYGWYPNQPRISLRYGEQPGSDGTFRATHSGRLWLYEYLANPTAAAALRKYTHDIMNVTNGTSWWGHSGPSLLKQGVINYVWFANPSGPKTDLTTLPLQRLFRETDSGQHSDSSAENYSWFSGFMSRTSFAPNSNGTLVWQDVSACCVDHYLDGNNSRSGLSPGHYHIIKGGNTLLAGSPGYYSTSACDTNGELPCYAGSDRRGQSVVAIGCDENENGCRDSGGTQIQPSMIRFSEDGGHAYTMSDLKTMTAGLSRYQRQLLHLKRPGQQDTIVVYDDVVTANPGTIKSRVVHMNSGMSGDGNATFDAGAGVFSSQSSNGSARLVTQMPNIDGQSHRIYRQGAATSGTLVDCVGSGSTCDPAATAAEFMAVHTPAAGSTVTPTLNTFAASGFQVAQIQYPNYAYVAAIKRSGTVQASANFNTSHSGTATYVVTGLQPGDYEVRRGGTVIVTSKNVKTSALVLEFESTAGAISVTRTSVPPLVISTTSLPNGQVGQPYSGTLQTTGGVPPTSWRGSVVKDGATPALKVDIGGTSWGAGSYEGSANVTPNAPHTGFQTINLPENTQIADTDLDRLFRNQVMCNDCSWTRAVGNGSYMVRLAFAEIIGEINYRQTFIRLNGTQVENNFSAYIAAGNRMNAAVWREYPVNVTNGQLEVRWGGSQGCIECRALLAGIEVSNRSGLTIMSSGQITGSPIENGTYRVFAEVSDTDQPPSGLAVELPIIVGGGGVGTALRTQALESAATGFIWRFGRPGLSTASNCSVTLARDAAFTDVVETRNVAGHKWREWSSITPLTPLTQYHLRAICGTESALNETASTVANSMVSRPVRLRIRSQEASADTLRVWYGDNEALSFEVGASCTLGICEVNIPAMVGRRLFYRYRLVRDGVTTATSRDFAMVP
jgi:hypothetical protein